MAALTARRDHAAGLRAPIAVIGEAVIEEFKARHANDRVLRTGGPAFRIARELALLGHASALVGSLGQDHDAELLTEALEDLGVRAFCTLREGEATGRLRLTQKKHRVKRKVEHPVTQRIGFDQQQLNTIDHAPLVVVAGFAFHDRKQHRGLLDSVLQPQNRLILDAKPPIGAEDDLVLVRERIERHASSALLVHLSASDSELLFDAPVDEVTSYLLDLGARNVLATEGSLGGRWVNREGLDVHEPAAELAGPVIDTVGAGDLVTALAVAQLIEHREDHGPDAAVDEAWARSFLRRAMHLAGHRIRGEVSWKGSCSLALRGDEQWGD